MRLDGDCCSFMVNDCIRVVLIMGRVQICAGRVSLIYAQNLIMHIDPWASSKSDEKSLAFYGVGEYDLWCFRVLYV